MDFSAPYLNEEERFRKDEDWTLPLAELDEKLAQTDVLKVVE